MEDKKLIKISKSILVVGILAWAVLGCLISFAKPSLTTSWIFEQYLGQSWSDFSSQQPRQASLQCHLVMMSYVGWLIGALFALFILFTSYRSGNRSTWVVLLVGTTLWAAIPIGFGIVFSDTVGIEWGIIFFVLSLISLGIGAKAAWSSR